MDKLKGNQNVRNTEKGTFAPETERDLPERVVETDSDNLPEAGPTQACRNNILSSTLDMSAAQDEAEVNQATVNTALAVMELRGQRLRELTEERLKRPE